MLRQLPRTLGNGADSLARQLSGLRGKYEACFLFLLLMIVEWLIPGPASLAQITPHPFWLPIILMSVQYGSGTGLIVAALATALSWLAGWPAQTSQEDFYTYSMRVWREPVLWIGAAIVIGGLRNRQIRERLALEERLHQTEHQRDTIAGFCHDLQEDLTAHERQAATARTGSIEAGLASLQRIRTTEALDNVRPLIQAAVTEWLGNAHWTLYPLRDGELTAAREATGDPETRAPVDIVRTAMVYAVACCRPRVLSVFDEADAQLLDGVGIFACPVRPIEGGPYHGLLVIESVPSDRLVPATVGAVLAIAHALGEAFDRGNGTPETAIQRSQDETTSHRDPARTRAASEEPRVSDALMGDMSCRS